MQSKSMLLTIVIAGILVTALPSISNAYAVTSTITTSGVACDALFGVGSWDNDETCTVSTNYAIPAGDTIKTNQFVILVINPGVTFTISDETELIADGAIENGGTFLVESGGSFVNKLSFTNDDTFTVDGNFESEGDFINNGLFTNSDSADIDGAVTNDGDIENNGSMSLTEDVENAGTIFNDGDVTFFDVDNTGDIENDGGEVDIQGIIDNDGTIVNTSGEMQTDANGVINNSATFTLEEDSEFIHNGLLNTLTTGTTTNSGEFTIDPFGALENSGLFDNEGLVTINLNEFNANEFGTVIVSSGTFVNSGEVIAAGEITIDGGTFENSGSLDTSGTIIVESGTFDNDQGGELTNSGATITVNGGSFPGIGDIVDNSPFAVTITSPTTFVFSDTTPILFSGNAFDTDELGNPILPAAIITWTSSISGALIPGGDSFTTTLGDGTHTITALANDGSGDFTDSIIITITGDVDGDGVSVSDGDCDDNDPNNFPGSHAETDDGQDNNCDATIDEGFDLDGDGFTPIGGKDCDDSNPLVYLDALELPDGLDNDCNEEVDDLVNKFTTPELQENLDRKTVKDFKKISYKFYYENQKLEHVNHYLDKQADRYEEKAANTTDPEKAAKYQAKADKLRDNIASNESLIEINDMQILVIKMSIGQVPVDWSQTIIVEYDNLTIKTMNEILDDIEDNIKEMEKLEKKAQKYDAKAAKQEAKGNLDKAEKYKLKATILREEIEIIEDLNEVLKCAIDFNFEMINDKESPVISDIPDDIIITLEDDQTSTPVSWDEPTATDNAVVISFTSTHNSDDTFEVGTTIVSYTARDLAGNTTTESFNIIILPAPGSIVSLDIPITRSSDDAEEHKSKMDLNSGDLDINEKAYVGLRFQNLAIPSGSTITNAYVQFTTEDDKDTGNAKVKISAQDSDDAETFTNSKKNISSRPTTSSLSWDIPNWVGQGTSGSAQQTPDISSQIQQVIDRQGWTSGNSIAIILEKHSGNDRDAELYDGDSSDAAYLHIEFSTGSTPPTNPANLVLNGDFESPIVSDHNGNWELFSDGTSGLEWSVIGGPLELQHGILGGPFEGEQHAELDSTNSVTISQTLNTVSGDVYDLSFAYKARPNTNANTNGLEVTWNGIDVAPGITLTNSWQTITVQVTGTGNDVLEFSDIGISNSYGTFLDNVSVTLN